MKPFLLLQIREQDGPANNEYADFLKYGQLDETDVVRIRMEKQSFSQLNPEDFSAIIVGGGPANVSDEETIKSHAQRRYEKELNSLYPRIFEKDIPFFGSCYGFGSIAAFAGAEISKTRFFEEVGFTQIKLNDASYSDKLFEDFPNTFKAFCGHKEACQDLPKGGVLLAGSDECPIQMIRFKKNIYAIQFHCELDAEGIAKRINYYKNHGYFDPEDAKKLINKTKNIITEEAHLILRRFVERYRV
ncbi:MAG: glutamine amidotransferase [Cytophagales bacterium]